MRIKYIAEDGKEFDDEAQCKNYEENIMIERLQIKRLNGVVPLTIIDGEVNFDNKFIWYKVNNKEELNSLKEEYAIEKGDLAINIFPEIICIEDDDHDNPPTYTLSDIKRLTKKFWGKMGYDLELKNVMGF